MTLGWSGSALDLFCTNALDLTFFIRALVGARRGEFGGDERSESKPWSTAGCFALGIMRSEVKCCFVCSSRGGVGGVGEQDDTARILTGCIGTVWYSTVQYRVHVPS